MANKKTYSFDEVKERYYGKKGTPERDALEQKLIDELEKAKKKQ